MGYSLKMIKIQEHARPCARWQRKFKSCSATCYRGKDKLKRMLSFTTHTWPQRCIKPTNNWFANELKFYVQIYYTTRISVNFTTVISELYCKSLFICTVEFYMKSERQVSGNNVDLLVELGLKCNTSLYLPLSGRFSNYTFHLYNALQFIFVENKSRELRIII